MATQLATRNGTEPHDLARLTPEEVQILKDTVCKGSTDSELSFFMALARRTGLDPFRKQIHSVEMWDSKLKKPVRTPIVGIDGLRVQAQRSGQYQGRIGPLWCGPDGQWLELWTSDAPPFAAKCGVRRAGFVDPVWAIARWKDYAFQTKAGGVREVKFIYKHLDAHMLGKCAEAGAIRAAFPEDAGGLYLREELALLRVAEQGDDDGQQQSTAPLPLRGSVRADGKFTPPAAKPDPATEDMRDEEDVIEGDVTDAEPEDGPPDEDSTEADFSDLDSSVVDIALSTLAECAGDPKALTELWNGEIAKLDAEVVALIKPAYLDMLADAQAATRTKARPRQAKLDE